MFIVNGFIWTVELVKPDNPVLYDYINDCQSLATTDFSTQTVYINCEIDNEMLLKVIKHELYHVFEFSGRVVYDLPLYEEEFVAMFFDLYAEELINLSYEIYNEIKK